MADVAFAASQSTLFDVCLVATSQPATALSVHWMQLDFDWRRGNIIGPKWEERFSSNTTTTRTHLDTRTTLLQPRMSLPIIHFRAAFFFLCSPAAFLRVCPLSKLFRLRLTILTILEARVVRGSEAAFLYVTPVLLSAHVSSRDQRSVCGLLELPVAATLTVPKRINK